MSLFTSCKDHKSKQAEEDVKEIRRITFKAQIASINSLIESTRNTPSVIKFVPNEPLARLLTIVKLFKENNFTKHPDSTLTNTAKILITNGILSKKDWRKVIYQYGLRTKSEIDWIRKNEDTIIRDTIYFLNWSENHLKRSVFQNEWKMIQNHVNNLK